MFLFFFPKGCFLFLFLFIFSSGWGRGLWGGEMYILICCMVMIELEAT